MEHDPLEIWANTQRVVAGALAQAALGAADVAAIGITNQRETTVVWDQPPASRSATPSSGRTRARDAICAALAQDGGQDRLRRSTGLPLATYFSGPKVRWMLDHVPGARGGRARRALFGTIDTWLIWNLTGGPSSDGAARHRCDQRLRTLLMNLRTLDWDDGILQLMRHPARDAARASAPPARSYGDAPAAALAGRPVAGDPGRPAGGAVRPDLLRPGEAKNTYGTGCFMLLNTGDEPVALADTAC